MLPDNGINQLCINGNLVSNKTRMAVDFNRFFKSVFARESIQHEAIPCEDDVNNLTLEQGVLSLLLSLDIKKSSGQVGLPSAFLKRYAEWVAKYINYIYSRSIKDAAALPNYWLIARVVVKKKAAKVAQLITTDPFP